MNGFRVDRQAGGRTDQCFGLEARPARFEGALGGEVDERTDGNGHDDEHDERDQVLGAADRECPVREDVEPVDEQRCRHRRNDPYEQSADRRNRQHHNERQQELRRQIDRVAERHGECDEDRQADDHEQPRDGGAATHGHASGVPAVWNFVRVGSSDDVHVDVGREAGHPCDEGPVDEFVPAAAPACAEHQLGGLLPAGERCHRFGRVRGDDVMDGAAEFVDEFALCGEGSVVLLREAVVDGDMDTDEFAADAACHARRTSDQRIAAHDAGEADDYSFGVSHGSEMPWASR